MRERCGNFDDNEIALEWVNHCNGTTIFPKLPFYLPSHYEKWKKNVLTRKQVESSKFKTGQERIKKLKKDSGENCAADVQLPLTLQTNTSGRSDSGATSTPTENASVVIAGTSISALVNPAEPLTRKRNGERGKDSKPRRKRTCALCKSSICPGRTNRNLCSAACTICKKLNCPGFQNPMLCNGIDENHTW